MKRKIFTLGLLSLAFSANAQSLLGVQDQASFHIKEDALIYSGGEVKTVAGGVIDNFGNVMIDGGGFKTVTSATNNTPKTTGGNFILRLWTKPGITNGDIVNGGDVIKYGQLYINGTTQNEVTGIVDKEYKDNAHGAYQQMAIPFYKKNFSELSTELSANLSGNRWNRTGILVWNNERVRFDHFGPSNNTTDILLASRNPVENNGATSYYAIGSRNFNAFSGGNINSLSTKVFTIKGDPFAGTITGTLTGAGQNVDFGPGGKYTNYFNERYNSYLGDNWEYTSSPWTGNYGKNIYQFGNPYLTNLNLKYLGTLVSNLIGVRIEPGTAVKASGDTSGVYLSYTGGVFVGDVKKTMVRPMGTFVIKLSSGNTTPLDFGKLRKFAYSASSSATPTYNGGVTVQSKSLNGDLLLSELSELNTNSTTKIANARLSNFTVKQLGVIALDADGKELGRTYYVVHANGISGQPTKLTTQVTANSKTVIGTFEEAKNGGVDENLINSYWLYINEANENDFKGKEIPMRIYSSDVKSLTFEILENAEDIADGQERLSSGESFYIFDGKKHVLVGNNKKISVSSDANFGLYYGKPAELVSSKNTIATIQKPSATVLAYDESIAAHKILFDPEWKKATVQVFDLSGRLIFSQANIDATKGEFVVNLPNAVRGTYVVTAVSDTGKKFSQKVIK